MIIHIELTYIFGVLVLLNPIKFGVTVHCHRRRQATAGTADRGVGYAEK